MPQTNSWDLYKDFTNPQDPEFQAKIRALAGMSMLVDPSMARVGNVNKYYRGMWTAPGVPEDKKVKAIKKSGQPLEQDKIYAFGPENTTPQIWAHEYRHRAGVTNEGLNRIYDAAMAGSDKKWNFAVNGYMEWLKENGTELSREDTIDFLDSVMPLIFQDKAATLPYKIFLEKERKGMLSKASPDIPKIKKTKR